MKKLTTLFSIPLLFVANLQAAEFQLKSTDITEGEFMSQQHEFQGFGCSGSNLSPQFSWSGAPKGTEAFAILAYDPDAPTGSGWWHWQVVNIPKNETSISSGAGNPDTKLFNGQAITIANDYGVKGFGGACPPQGHGVHRYQFTIHALSKPLDLPPNASGALTGYMVKAHSIGSSTIEALYKRK